MDENTIENFTESIRLIKSAVSNRYGWSIGVKGIDKEAIKRLEEANKELNLKFINEKHG